jgi:hypothetical protein
LTERDISDVFFYQVTPKYAWLQNNKIATTFSKAFLSAIIYPTPLLLSLLSHPEVILLIRMNIHIIQILPRISQEDLDLFGLQNLAQWLSSHGSEHVVDSSLEVQSDEPKFLVLLRVSMFGLERKLAFTFAHVPMGTLRTLRDTLVKPAFSRGSRKFSPARNFMPKLATASSAVSKNLARGASGAREPSSQLARASSSWISIQAPGFM